MIRLQSLSVDPQLRRSAIQPPGSPSDQGLCAFDVQRGDLSSLPAMVETRRAGTRRTGSRTNSARGWGSKNDGRRIFNRVEEQPSKNFRWEIRDRDCTGAFDRTKTVINAEANGSRTNRRMFDFRGGIQHREKIGEPWKTTGVQRRRRNAKQDPMNHSPGIDNRQTNPLRSPLCLLPLALSFRTSVIGASSSPRRYSHGGSFSRAGSTSRAQGKRFLFRHSAIGYASTLRRHLLVALFVNIIFTGKTTTVSRTKDARLVFRFSKGATTPPGFPIPFEEAK